MISVTNTFAQNTYYSQKSNQPFSSFFNWNTSPNGTGTVPTNIDELITGKANIVIQKDHVIQLDKDADFLSLTLESGSSFKIDGYNVTVNGNLTINAASGSATSTINFGTTTTTLTVLGALKGGENSTIIHAAGAKLTQQLILYGENNTLDFFTNTSTGTSVVNYAATKVNQRVFNSDQYSNLILEGAGIKSLNPNATKGKTARVTNSLKINNCQIQLNDFNFIYAGSENELSISNGWVNTNGSGSYINNSTESTRSFPIGNDTYFQPVRISNIKVQTATIGIRIGQPNKQTDAVPYDGAGIWHITTTQETSATIEVIAPSASAPLKPSSQIALYDGVWKTQPTVFNKLNLIYSTDILIPNSIALSIYSCPTLSNKPSILPTSLPVVIEGQTYKQSFSLSDKSSVSNLSISKLPLSTTFSNGELVVTNPIIQSTPFEITYASGGCTFTQEYTLKVISLLSPNLSVNNINSKSIEDRDFKVLSTSRSNGKITYALATGSGTCAKIDATTGVVHINCAGPSPENQITISVNQEATGTYKSETVTKSFLITPTPGKIGIKNFGFVVGNSKSINAFSNSNGVITFDQLTGFIEAKVQSDGTVNPTSEGDFTVHISLAATNNYTAFDSIYTFNINSIQVRPIATSDTIKLTMDKDSTINILANDFGMSEEIISSQTDIDVENAGLQLKFYATGFGNFIIDSVGNLTIIPFNGFIGKGKLGYTVKDLNGLTSEIAYVEIMIEAPYVLPPLKANQLMTPNNDGFNDGLVIAYSNINADNSLIVIDGVGNTVFETINYQNDWMGTDKKGTPLEAGVYFYVYQEKKSDRFLKQYVQIVR